MAGLTSKVDDVRGDQSLLQSLINRVNTLENKPDEQKRLLDEYVRNWDSLTQQVGKIQNGQMLFSQSVQKLLKNMAYYVQHKQITIDASTIEALRAVVEAKTNNSLDKYISQVQVKAINANFQKLVNAINDQEAPIKEKLDTINKRLDGIDYKIEQLDHVFTVLMYVTIAMLLAGAFAGMTLWLNALNHHPVLAWIVLLVIAGLGIWAFKRANQESEDE